MDSKFIYHIFLLNLHHRSATTAVVRNDFNEKGVIEIIFIDEILAKFLCCEGDSSSATSWFVQPQLASYIPFGVGYCFIRVKGNAKA